MKGLRLMIAILVGSALAFAGCEKGKQESSKPAVEHTYDDGHDHSTHGGNEGLNH